MPAHQADPQPTRIDVVGEINTSIAYANFAKVVVTPLDAIITFACIDPATAFAGEEGEGPAESVDASVVARIVLPRTVLTALERAIHDQIEKASEREASCAEG